MAPSRVLLAAFVLAAIPLYGCSRESVVGPANGRQGLVLADADVAQCPAGTEGAGPATCGYPSSYGRAVGRAQLQHTPDSPDRPNTKAQIEFGFQTDPKDTVRMVDSPPNPANHTVDTFPRGRIRFRNAGTLRSTSDDLEFQGTDPFVFQVDLDSDNTSIPLDVGGPGNIYVEGDGTMNGQGGWFYCMFARDNFGARKRPDRVDIRFWEGSSPGASCQQPTHRLLATVVSGDIDAQEGHGDP